MKKESYALQIRRQAHDKVNVVQIINYITLYMSNKSATNLAYSIFRRFRLETLFVSIEAFIERFIPWEKSVTLLLLGQRGHYFIDVGASRGVYEIMLHNKFDKIDAFEPMTENFMLLRKTTRNMKNVTCYKFAVGNFDGATKLHVDAISKQGNSILDKFATGTVVETVRIMRLWTFLNELVDLIKVDVEGAEMLVLEGARGILPLVRQWIIEVHNVENVLIPPSEERKASFESFFKDNGYDTKWLDVRHIYAYRNN